MKSGLGQLLDLAAFDHPPVTHKGHPLAAKALAHLADLGAKRFRVLRIAAEHFRRDRRTLFVAQQADDNLFLAFLAVAIIAVGAQGVVLPFQIAAGAVVEEQLRLALSAPGQEQPLLDLLLVLAQPGQILVQIVFVEAAPDAQHVAGGMHLGQADGRETRALIQEAGDDLPHSQLAGKAGAEGLLDAEAAGHFGRDPDGTDGSAFPQLHTVEGGEGGQIALVLEGEFDGGDGSGIAVGEVGDIALLDFAVLAEGFAEVDGLVDFAVGGGPEGAGYIDVHIMQQDLPVIKRQSH